MNTQQATVKFAELFAAITARQAAQASRDNELTLAYMVRAEKSIKKGMTKISVDLFDAMTKGQNPEAKKASAGYIAVKVNVKIVRLLDAIGSGMGNAIDDYTMTIVANALHNQGAIFAKSALVCLSRDIEFQATDLTQVIKNRMRVHASTASTQRSSTRQALHILGLAEVVKNKTDDTITLTEKGASVLGRMVNGLSAETEEHEETETA